MIFSRIAAFRLVTQRPEALLAFYSALGFEVGEARSIAETERAILGIDATGTRWPMRLGKAIVELDRFDAPGRPYPLETDAATQCFQHFALVTDDVTAAWTRAQAAGATPISNDGPVMLPASSGGATAIKFRDPEGHPLELLQFPDLAEKGWSGTGMIGIDHSAIVVRDRSASETYYTAHGLARGEVTLNHGSEQAALDGLYDPVVDVIPMLPQQGPPHVELLHYRQPTGVQVAPVYVADVAATRIVWQGGTPALVRGPDGHLHQTGG